MVSTSNIATFMPPPTLRVRDSRILFPADTEDSALNTSLSSNGNGIPLSYRNTIFALNGLFERIDLDNPPPLFCPNVINSVGFTDGTWQMPPLEITDTCLAGVRAHVLNGTLLSVDRKEFLDGLTLYFESDPKKPPIPLLHPRIPRKIQERIRKVWVALARKYCPPGIGFGDMGYSIPSHVQ